MLPDVPGGPVVRPSKGAHPVHEPQGTVGVRVSPHPLVARLVRSLGGPLTSTSLNLPGAEPVYFLCAFDRLGHQNMGYDEDWSDLERFEQAALRLVDDYIARGDLVATTLQ